VIVLFSALLTAQTPNALPSFEVASIKPSPPRVPGQRVMFGSRGGPGTDDPGMFRCSNCNLVMLIMQAYDLKSYQLTAPGLSNDSRFEVTAKVPTGTTKEQFQLMLQSLLAERFKLTVHREKKEMQVFDLVVAKGGPKLIEHRADPAKEEAVAEPMPPLGARGGRGPNLDKDGYPVIPKSCNGCMMVVGGGKARMQWTDAPIKDLADLVGDQLERPVTDATGLKGKYDMSVTFQMSFPGGGRGGDAGAGADRPLDSADGDTGVTLAGALGPQLGLKLESRKGSVEMLVVDHAEKFPTEN
jgi:uncharacterized protein (TIGR03435 family)